MRISDLNLTNYLPGVLKKQMAMIVLRIGLTCVGFEARTIVRSDAQELVCLFKFSTTVLCNECMLLQLNRNLLVVRYLV